MKKSTIVIIAFVLIYVVCALFSAFEPTLKRVRNPQNVYDELWNLFVAESQGETTVLTTATKDTRFRITDESISLSIPEGNIVLEWDCSSYNAKGKQGKGVLRIRMWDDDGKSHWYWYDNESKVLRGEDAEMYMKRWLRKYYQWCEESDTFSSQFSADDRGTYTYQRGSSGFNESYVN